MARPATTRSSRGFGYDFLTFQRPMSAPLAHLIYWAGLALIALISFGVVGGAVGMIIRGGGLEGALLALPVLAGGLLLCVILAVLWRGAAEFYLAVFRIAEDLNVLREAVEREEAEHRRLADAQGAPPSVRSQAG